MKKQDKDDKKEKKSARVDLKGLPLGAIIEKLNAHYGANTLALASKALGLHVQFISTGVYAIDFGAGGGIPKNRITEIRGPFSSLKSTICYKTMANFQRMNKRSMVFFQDGEKTFDPVYAQICGCDLARIAIINSDSGEQAIDVLSDLLDIGDVDVLVVVDSIASLVPSAELEASMDQQFQGLHPRLINRMMRILVGGMKRCMYDESAPSLTVLVTNQIREKIGVVYGNPETTPGGRGKDFAYSLMIKVFSSPSDRIMEKVVQHGQERNVRFGQNVKFQVSKNKVSASQFEEGEFEYYVREYKGHPANSFNNEEILFRYGVFYGVIEQRMQKSTKKGGKPTVVYTYGNIDYAEDAFKRELVKDVDASNALYLEVLQAISDDAMSKSPAVPSGVRALTEDTEEDDYVPVIKKNNSKVKIRIKA